MKANGFPWRKNACGRPSGFTLIELMISTAVCLVLFGALTETFVALQRSFKAALYQMDAQGDENRVLAYLSKDLRDASSVQLNAGGTDITLTIPGQAAPTLNLNLSLPLLSLLAPAGSPAAPATTIRYYRQGSTIIRDVSGQTTELSASATQFLVTQTGPVARIDTAFQPQFSLQTNSGTPPVSQMTAYVNLLNASQISP